MVGFGYPASKHHHVFDHDGGVGIEKHTTSGEDDILVSLN
jgi:hypothetical protein